MAYRYRVANEQLNKLLPACWPSWSFAEPLRTKSKMQIHLTVDVSVIDCLTLDKRLKKDLVYRHKLKEIVPEINQINFL